MRKVIATEFMTLDGLMLDPADEMEWVQNTLSEEQEEEIRRHQNQADTMLLGRVTYEILASYWPTATAEQEYPEMIDHMNNTPKVVFSRTLDKAEWNNSKLVKDNIAEEVQRLKEQPGKNMIIVGSASIVQALTNLGLVDEYRF